MGQIDSNDDIRWRIDRKINRHTTTHVGRMLNIKGGVRLKAPFDVLPFERGRTRWDNVESLGLGHRLDDVGQEIRCSFMLE